MSWSIFVFFVCSLYASTPKGQTICLNMIVKNEKDVIENCLNSVKDFIDYWVIFDTGSTDGTQAVIEKTLKGIPGELHQSSWMDFAYNRNEALNQAKTKGDYLLFIDADEKYVYEEGFKLPPLSADAYHVRVLNGQSLGTRTGLINASLDWKWVEPLHEVLVSNEAKHFDYLEGIQIFCHTDQGARAKDNHTFLKDAMVLEKALAKDPDNARNVYYLAQSYENAGCDDKALEYYERRLRMPSTDLEQTFHALLRVGILHDKCSRFEKAIHAFTQAHLLLPYRAESFYLLAQTYRKQGNLLAGYLAAKHGLELPYPKKDYLILSYIYDYAFLIELANSALLLGKYEEGLNVCEKLLNSPHLPEEYRERVKMNWGVAQKNLH